MRRIALGLVIALTLSGCAWVTRVDVRSDGSTVPGSRAAMAAVNYDATIAYFSTDAQLVPADTDTTADIYRRDIVAGTTQLVTTVDDRPNANSNPDTDLSGGLVVFTTEADIDASDTHDLAPDVYLYDENANTFTRVSVQSDGSDIPNHFGAGPALISGDGAFVTFETSDASNTTHLYVWHRADATTTEVPVNSSEGLVGISDDGSRLLTLDSGGVVTAHDWQTDGSIVLSCPAQSAALHRDGGTVIADFANSNDPNCPDHIAEVDLSNPGSYNDISSAHGDLTPRSISIDNRLFAYTLTADPEADPADVGQLIVGSTVGAPSQRASDSALGVPATPPPIVGGIISGDGTAVAFPAHRVEGMPSSSGELGVYLHAALRPVVDGVTPNSLPRGSTSVPVTVSLNSVGRPVLDFGPGVHVVQQFDGFRVTVDADAAPGPRNVMVVDRGPVASSIGVCLGCFTVT